MTKNDLIQRLKTTMGVSERAAKEALDCVIEGLEFGLRNDREVKLRPFGTFVLKHRDARTARNPQNGEEVHVPARNVVAFRASKELKEDVNRRQHYPVY